jgi:nucleotide-binding universal stress UspA family protein
VGGTARTRRLITITDTVVIWVTEGTWRASVDAALRFVPGDAPIALLHVTPEELPEAAHGAYLGLFGRGRPARDDPGERVAELARVSAGELLDAAAGRLGRPCQRLERRGNPEREVVTAVADAGLLIVARDGDRSRLGPKSLGKAVRFVVDHAPCPVLVVWPEAAPGVDSIPPPPHKGGPHEPPRPPHGPPGPRRGPDGDYH